ncbi:MAG: superoxide dismutase [Candidatus Levybacteria bacterium CG10_big_fil_rev_8_21_14_0_10_36_7]|nr:MAG: superoxide dismutase [Candidatus Levybacteria bacterium CG10_big_fil_rev_8_21_14_0_10_36_7]
MKNNYTLPGLHYGYSDLAPHISEEQLTIHHSKHHQGYVDGANKILDQLEEARKNNTEIDSKSVLKNLSFNIGGHILHSLFWDNLSPNGGGEPAGKLKSAIDEDFGSFERFKEEFSKSAVSVEGSGWSALVVDKKSGRLLIMQIEKHNTNIYPESKILMVVDVWEHAYYLDYKNARAEFVEAFWNILNWGEIEKRFSA